MWVHPYVASPCSLRGFNSFDKREVFSIDVCHLFPQCLLNIIPLLGGVTDVVVIRVIAGWCAVPPLRSGCHCPIWGRVSSLVFGVEAPRSVSELCFWAVVWEVDRIGVLPLWEEPLSIPLSELFTNKSALLCHLSSTVWAHEVNCCWYWLNPLVQSWEWQQLALASLQVLFSQDH